MAPVPRGGIIPCLQCTHPSFQLVTSYIFLIMCLVHTVWTLGDEEGHDGR